MIFVWLASKIDDGICLIQISPLPWLNNAVRRDAYDGGLKHPDRAFMIHGRSELALCIIFNECLKTRSSLKKLSGKLGETGGVDPKVLHCFNARFIFYTDS